MDGSPAFLEMLSYVVSGPHYSLQRVAEVMSNHRCGLTDGHETLRLGETFLHLLAFSDITSETKGPYLSIIFDEEYRDSVDNGTIRSMQFSLLPPQLIEMRRRDSPVAPFSITMLLAISRSSGKMKSSGSRPTKFIWVI